MKKLAINALNICDDISNIDSYLLVIKKKKYYTKYLVILIFNMKTAIFKY